MPSAADFRGHGRDPVPPLLAREMRRAEQYREAVLELEGPTGAPSLVGHIDRKNLEARAREMRGLLGLADGFLPESKRGKQPLANRTSGLCALEEGRNEEALANAFAANFLMSEAGITELVSDVVQDSWDIAETVVENFEVSTLAAGTRLKTLGLISLRRRFGEYSHKPRLTAPRLVISPLAHVVVVGVDDLRLQQCGHLGRGYGRGLDANHEVQQLLTLVDGARGQRLAQKRARSLGRQNESPFSE